MPATSGASLPVLFGLEEVARHLSVLAQDDEQRFTDGNVPRLAVLGLPVVVRSDMAHRTTLAGLGIDRFEVQILPALHDDLFDA
jgi:hypothetical protein